MTCKYKHTPFNMKFSLHLLLNANLYNPVQLNPTELPALLIAVQLSRSVLDKKTDRFVVICETNHDWSLTQLDNLFEHWHFRQPLECLTLKTP